MKSIVRTALAALLAMAAVPAQAQPGAPPRRQGPPPEMGMEDQARRPFDVLLRHRGELQLSAEQAQRIELIGRRLEEQNAPLRQRLMQEHQRWRDERRAQLERMTAEQRRAELRRMREHRGQAPVPENLRPLVHQMRLNINEAMHQAQGVLTAEQRLRAQAIVRRELRPAPRPGVRGPAGARAPRPGVRRPGARQP